jgi:hypothetical protein
MLMACSGVRHEALLELGDAGVDAEAYLQGKKL